MSKELTVIKEETVDAVAKRVEAMEGKGELHLPQDYSAPNALKSAWLMLQETKDKNDKPALEVCTRVSILNALLDMVIMAMNPAKKQVYFIVYGKQLACQRSYFGSMALAKRVDSDIEDIIAEPVYQGDDLEYEIIKGRKHIIKHKQTIAAVNSKNVVATYCMVLDKNGEVKKTDLMTFEEIKMAWKKSKMQPVNKDGTIKTGSVHDEFMAEMCRRTAINRTCKPIINSSDDKHLKIAAMRSEVVEAEEDALLQIEEHANQEVIDVDDTEAEQKPQGPGPTWNPCTSEIQQRYGADKAEILKEICAAREINIGGLTAKEAHEKLLEVVAKEPEQTQGPKEEVEGKGENGGQPETEELPKKENDKQFVYCPIQHRRVGIPNCETNKCKIFLTCDTVQDKIAKLMEEERVAAALAAASEEAAAGPGF